MSKNKVGNKKSSTNKESRGRSRPKKNILPTIESGRRKKACIENASQKSKSRRTLKRPKVWCFCYTDCKKINSKNSEADYEKSTIYNSQKVT